MKQNPVDGQTKQWASQVLEKMDEKMCYGVEKAKEIKGIPYTVKVGGGIGSKARLRLHRSRWRARLRNHNKIVFCTSR